MGMCFAKLRKSRQKNRHISSYPTCKKQQAVIRTDVAIEISELETGCDACRTLYSGMKMGAVAVGRNIDCVCQPPTTSDFIGSCLLLGLIPASNSWRVLFRDFHDFFHCILHEGLFFGRQRLKLRIYGVHPPVISVL